MKYLLILGLILNINNALAKSQDKLLDKIAIVIDDNTVTLSKLKRIQSNIPARRSIAPMIYEKDKYSYRELAEMQINKYLIRSYLQTIGYIITNDQVESQIKQTEKRLGLTRAQLLSFLKNNNMSFEEYFQLTKETIEYMSLFVPRVIIPLVSISDQEIKNYYYKKNRSKKTLSFKYTLHDYSIAKNKVKNSILKNINNILANFQLTGNLPAELQDMQTNVIADVTEDGLIPSIKQQLKRTNEGEFTRPIILNGDYHIFFVKKKDLVESEEFLQIKKQLAAELKEKKIKNVIKSWFQREKAKHFIKINL